MIMPNLLQTSPKFMLQISNIIYCASIQHVQVFSFKIVYKWLDEHVFEDFYAFHIFAIVKYYIINWYDPSIIAYNK